MGLRRILNPIQSSFFQVLCGRLLAGPLFSINLMWMNSAHTDPQISIIFLQLEAIGNWVRGSFAQA